MRRGKSLILILLSSLALLMTYQNLLSLIRDHHRKIRQPVVKIPVSRPKNDLEKKDFDNNLNELNDLKSRNFDEYCDIFGEWSPIGLTYFIRKNYVFYFMDAKLLHFRLLKRGQAELNFTLYLTLENEAKEIINALHISQEKLNTRVDGWSSDYVSTIVETSLRNELRDFFPGNQNTKQLKMYLKVSSLNGLESTRFSLKVKVKNFNTEFNTKKNAMICGRCLFLNRDELKPLDWWLKMHRRAGFDAVFLCDHDLDDSQGDFTALFNKHEDFVYLDRLECVPNLQNYKKDRPKKYLRSYKELTYRENGALDRGKIVVLDQIITNDCYMEFIDKYKYIATIDIDEIFISNWAANFFTLGEKFSFIVENKEENLLDKVKCDRYVEHDNEMISNGFSQK
jgi:hypothetical protein